MSINKKQLNKGFTIVESLIAVAILVLSVTGAASAVQSSISSYIFSKDQIIASYLAQEAVEQIRNVRDRNALNNQNWLTGISLNLNDPCYFGNFCTVDSIGTPTFVRCIDDAEDCPVLRQDLSATGLFGYDIDWTPTVFQRYVELEQLNANEIVVFVTIKWSKGLALREFVVTEYLLNWQ